MYTKADFQQKIKDNIQKYPTIAAYYEANDPRINQHLDAIATMAAMLSAQIETAQNESFQKTRDSTVLADAAMRGIVRKGTAARAQILATNTGDTAFTVETGRQLIDANGRTWQIATPVTVEPGESGTFEAVQMNTVTETHTVSGSVPFYAIQIPDAEDDSYLYGVTVSDDDGEFQYKEGYSNTEKDERCYHLEADERQNLYVRFGWEDVVGYQPQDGDVLTLTYAYTAGNITMDLGSPFSFMYLQSPYESNIDLSFESMLIAGSDPISMDVLRDLARYPSVYNYNAVFLGEFDFLIRRSFPNLQFLSIWNEAIEESARGASLDNVNALFVACLSETGDEKTKTAYVDDIPAPDEIAEDELTETQLAIKEKILDADDTYRVRFFTPVIKKIWVIINATISTSYNSTEIQQKIVETLVNNYGVKAAAARRGQMKLLYRKVYQLLREKVPALSDGESDLTVSIENASTNNPETWQYVDESSLVVTVSTENITTQSWGF